MDWRAATELRSARDIRAPPGQDDGSPVRSPGSCRSMAHRTNHYDAAFEALLLAWKVPHVRVDEARRSKFESGSLKSPDFLVSPPRSTSLVVDVKGRRFGRGPGLRTWENWATADDLVSLAHWQSLFGDGFRSALVFLYDLDAAGDATHFAETFQFRERLYAAVGVYADDYRARMVQRSESWQTVHVPSADYAELRVPLREMLGMREGEETEGRRDRETEGGSASVH